VSETAARNTPLWVISKLIVNELADVSDLNHSAAVVQRLFGGLE
jgi:hypothetical protein